VKEYLEPVALAAAYPNPQTVCEPVEFDATESYAQTGDYISNYEWNFNGDGMYWVDAGPTPSYSFNHIGTYSVGFRVKDNNGYYGYLVPPLAVNIENALPTAIALANKYEVMENEPVYFDASESHDNDCGNSEITQYDWSFNGDGYYQVDIGPTPVHSYSVFGVYNVNLRVWDNEGGTDYLDEPMEITVNKDMSKPVAIADRNPPLQIICEPVYFYDNGSYAQSGNYIVKYEWDWDNDGYYDEEGIEAYHTWYEPGTYHIGFRVTDNLGNTGELEMPLPVIYMHNSPTAAAEADKYTAGPYEDIQFDGSASHDNDCDGMEITKYEWDFRGDGYYWVDAGPMPVHSYSVYGTYNVKLRVTDDENVIDYLDTPLSITIEYQHAECLGYNEIEPNDYCPTDNALVFDLPAYGCVKAYSSSPGWDDIDFWKFEIPDYGTMDIHLYNDGEGDIDLGYNSGDCTWLGGSGWHGPGEDEWLYGVPVVPGTYYVHVSADNISYDPERPYHLVVTYYQ
jgi:PKD repeat protein